MHDLLTSLTAINNELIYPSWQRMLNRQLNLHFNELVKVIIQFTFATKGNIINPLVNNLLMGVSNTEKLIFIGGLGVVAALVALHIVTGIKGYHYFKDEVQLKAKLMPQLFTLNITYQEYEARVIMLMAVAGLTFLTSALAIWLVTKPKLIKWLQHVTVFNMTIEVGIGLIMGISLYEMSITRDVYIDKVYKTPEVANIFWDQDGFNTFWSILIADTITTFVQIIFLIYMYISVANKASKSEYGGQLSSENSHYNKV